jgi:2-polyprenyl-3-methyl-5-hydroxy-6-metoxy-1,4-benzoquinol methylase
MKRVDPKHYTKEYYLSDATGYEEYLRTNGTQLEVRLSRIVKEIPSVKGLKVLDIGCGRGELAYWAARMGAKKVVGIDYSKAAINLANQAKKTWPKKYQQIIMFKHVDAKKLKYNESSFDVILMTEVLEHLYPDEKLLIFKNINKLLKPNGFAFIHTAPTLWFNNFTYRIWCYPVSSLLVKLSNLLTGHRYVNIPKPSNIRTHYHKIMHIDESNYFSLKNLFHKTGFKGNIRSTNITVNKPRFSWKDDLFNLIVYLTPLSNYPPLNVFWGNDYYALLRKKL